MNGGNDDAPPGVNEPGKLIAPAVAGAIDENAKFSTSPGTVMMHCIKSAPYGRRARWLAISVAPGGRVGTGRPWPTFVGAHAPRAGVDHDPLLAAAPLAHTTGHR